MDYNPDVYEQIIALKQRCYTEDVLLKNRISPHDKKYATLLEGWIAKTYLIQKDIERFMALDVPPEKKERYLFLLKEMLQTFVDMIDFEQIGTEKRTR